MKEKDGIADCPEQQMILYVEKEDGQYGPMQTGSYISANYLDDFFFKRKNLEASLLKRVQSGEISPIHSYMILEDLTLSELASRVRLCKWTVKRHLKTRNFGIIKAPVLDRYATVFNVTTEELKKLGSLKTENPENEN